MENDNCLNFSEFINNFELNKHNFLDEDLLFKHEINIDFLRNKDHANMQKKEDIENKEYDLDCLKFNLSSKTGSNIHNNIYFSKNNNVNENPFQNIFDNNFLNNLHKQESNPFLPDNENSFTNKFLKDFIIKKVENILTSDNLQEKLMLYYIISTSDPNILKEKSQQLFKNNQIAFNSSIQKEIVGNIINEFCKHLTRNGFSIAEKAEKAEKAERVERAEQNDKQINKKNETKKNSKSKNKKNLQNKKAWLCPHVYRENYAKGKCQNCYLSFYKKIKIKNLKSNASNSDDGS